MKKTFSATTVGVLLMAGCSSDTRSGTAEKATTTTSAPTKVSHVQLGQPVSLLGPAGVIISITNTAISQTGCPPEATTRPGIRTQLLLARVSTGTTTQPQWLAPRDLYYLTADGTVLQQTDLAGPLPCPATDFTDLGPNTSKIGSVSLDIPLDATVIGYRVHPYGSDTKAIEWTLPEPAPKPSPSADSNQAA